MVTSHRLAAIVFVILYLAVVAPGQAEVISGPFVTTTPISATLTDWNSSLAFPQFDSSLGSLISVQLDLSGSISTVLEVTNTGESASTGNAKMEVQLSVQDSGSNFSVPQLDLLSPAFAFTDLQPTQSVTSGTLTKSGSSSDVYTSAAVLAEFTGTGSVVLPASTYSETWITYNGGNACAEQETYAELTGSVTYRYAAVPEPSTLALLGVCGFGLLAAAWRRRKG